MSHVIHEGVVGLHEGDPLHLYANADTGNDRNSGLASDKAKATLPALIAVMPKALSSQTSEIKVVLHLEGTFTNQEVDVSCVLNNCSILIDGGSSIAKKTGTNDSYTASSSSTTSVTDNTQTWTTDEFAGWWVEILTGNAAGNIRTIQRNDATTIYPTANFSDTSATFRICRPATTIEGTGGNTGALYNSATSTGRGRLFYQRLYVSGKARIGHYSGNETAPAWYMGCIVDTSDAFGLITWGAAMVAFVDARYDPTTLAYSSSPNAGTSVLSSACYLSNVGYLQFNASYIKGLLLSATKWFLIGKGTRLDKAYFRNVTDSRLNEPPLSAAPNISSEAGYANVLFTNSAGDGLYCMNSNFRVGDLVEFSNNGGHGINCERSYIYFNNATSGSGNTGAGLYAHDGSVIHVKDGVTPTLTGTVGDIAVTSPTQEDITWAEVSAGENLSIAAEHTLVKKVA